ncbi:vegetative catalase-like [Brevipalpus obovatus]|uniref:vegetative catalase-like n=1 Tax=Brevipalpus obovatus TaxID=246614 RepID=UPI003D9DD62C
MQYLLKWLTRIFAVIYSLSIFPSDAESLASSQNLKSGFSQSHNLNQQTRISLLSDDNFRTKIQSFNRERIPGRRSFGTGNGAFGFFETTSEQIGSLSKAKIFEKIGKRCKIVTRLSSGPARVDKPQVVGNDAAGFSIRFFTTEGNWDLLTMTTPVSSFRDPSRTFEGIHALEERPLNNQAYPDQIKDMNTILPEGFHSLMWQYSDVGLHKNWRVLTGFSICAFKLVNSEGEYVNVRFSIKAKKKYDYLTLDEANWFRGYVPDYYARDLYAAIDRGDFPEFSLRIQIVEPKDEDNFDFFLFDPTKMWDERRFPWITIGRIVLNENPKNWFSEIESLALNPMNLIPGIETAFDRVTQSRLFIYSDTHRFRLGTNHQLLPINKPLNLPKPIHPDAGFCTKSSDQQNFNGNLLYSESQKSGPTQGSRPFQIPGGTLIRRHDVSYLDNYSQPNQTWMSFGRGQQERLVERLSLDLLASRPETRIRFLKHAKILNPDWCHKLALAIGLDDRC